MKEIIGTCKFCGQSVMVVVPDEATPEIILEESAMNCKCKEAQAYREKKEREEKLEMAKTSAQGTTFELFHEEHSDIEEIFNDCMDKVIKHGYTITINTKGKTKAKMKFAKDVITVTREDKSTYQRETEV